jgi:hypothetical protein
MEAVARYLRESEGLDVVKVLTFHERTQSSGFCDTCYFEYQVVDIAYEDSNGDYQKYVWSDDFADLVRALTD